jgi:hypothetical protein
MAPSLADTISEIVEDFQVPVPTATVRVVASARRGKPVPAESLSRLAGAQREEFSRSGLPPRLCDVIDEEARALRPRVWARGDWRLARRVATADALSGWQTRLALGLCREMERAGPGAPDALGRVALEAIARVLGPVAGYTPGNSEDWEGFARQVASRLPGPGLALHTSDQGKAERRLLDHQPSLPSEGLYFGLSDGFKLAPDERDPELLRLPVAGEKAEPFHEVLRRRVDHDAEFRALVAYLQGYSYLMDRLGRGPTSDEFARHWHFSSDSVRADEELFARAFPEEQTPERVLHLLDRGLPGGGALVWLLDVRVVDLSHTRSGSSSPAAGQRWRSPDGQELTVIDVDGNQVVGGLHDRGTTSLWVGDFGKLRRWSLVLPGWAWRLHFNLASAPKDLIERLHAGEVIVERLARPGGPGPDRHGLPAATEVAHVIANSEGEARGRLLAAIRGHAQLEPDSLRVERLGRPE